METLIEFLYLRELFKLKLNLSKVNSPKEIQQFFEFYKEGVIYSHICLSCSIPITINFINIKPNLLLMVLSHKCIKIPSIDNPLSNSHRQIIILENINNKSQITFLLDLKKFHKNNFNNLLYFGLNFVISLKYLL